MFECAELRNFATKNSKKKKKNIVYRHHIEPQKTLMIGDRLNTDITFGNTNGMDTALVLTGVSKESDIETENIYPTYVLKHAGQLTQES